MDSQKGKLSTTNPTTTVKDPSDVTKLAMLNEQISAIDQFESDAQVGSETLVKIEDNDSSRPKIRHLDATSPSSLLKSADAEIELTPDYTPIPLADKGHLREEARDITERMLRNRRKRMGVRWQ